MNGLSNGLKADGGSLLEPQPVPVEAVLLQENEAEFSLSSRVAGCWITVDSLAVRLWRDEGRLLVQVFPLHHEDETAIAQLDVVNPTPF